MKVLVPCKRVVDYNVKIRVNSEQTGVVTDNVKMSLNPFDEIALEQAVQLKEQGIATEVIAVSIGEGKCQETLRTALAMGADSALLIETSDDLQPLEIAKCLQALVEQQNPNLVLMGKQSIDGDNNQTGQMLAGLLNWAQGTFVSQLEIADNKATVTREVDGGLEVLSLQLPAVITTDLRLNTPRYPSMPNIMKAKQKPLEVITLDSLGIKPVQRITVTKVVEPQARSAGEILESVSQLIDKLKNEAKVIT